MEWPTSTGARCQTMPKRAARSVYRPGEKRSLSSATCRPRFILTPKRRHRREAHRLAYDLTPIATALDLTEVEPRRCPAAARAAASASIALFRGTLGRTTHDCGSSAARAPKLAPRTRLMRAPCAWSKVVQQVCGRLNPVTDHPSLTCDTSETRRARGAALPHANCQPPVDPHPWDLVPPTGSEPSARISSAAGDPERTRRGCDPGRASPSRVRQSLLPRREPHAVRPA